MWGESPTLSVILYGSSLYKHTLNTKLISITKPTSMNGSLTHPLGPPLHALVPVLPNSRSPMWLRPVELVAGSASRFQPVEVFRAYGAEGSRVPRLVRPLWRCLGSARTLWACWTAGCWKQRNEFIRSLTPRKLVRMESHKLAPTRLGRQLFLRYSSAGYLCDVETRNTFIYLKKIVELQIRFCINQDVSTSE